MQAYKSRAHFMWTTNGFTEKLSAVRVYQATNRVLLAALEKLRGTTQKEDVKKTPAKMLPSTCSKHCMCTICIVVNDYNKQIEM